MTDVELLQTLREVRPWDESKTDALLELFRRKVDAKIIATAAQSGLPTECEHGRNIWDTCLACEEIEEANESLEDNA